MASFHQRSPLYINRALRALKCHIVFYSHTLHLHYFAARWHGQELIFLKSTQIRKITQFIMSGSKLSMPPYTRGEKKKHLV